MSFLLGSVFSCGAFLFFAWKRVCRYLHIYQQDEYDTSRFLPWLFQTLTFDRHVSLALAVLVVGGVLDVVPQEIGPYLAGIFFLIFGMCEADPKKVAKKPLVLTKRAIRLLGVTMFLIGLSAGGVGFIGSVWPWILLVQALPVLMMIANALLHPVESGIQRHFLHEAQLRLAEVKPLIIGITGSFGKTSAKHILGNILDLNASAYYTPGSVNTLMGISRMIREKLPAESAFFVVEMGAYGKGSIERLCALTPPKLGIITALGAAHYERFKDLDTVARAKFELADATLKHPEGRVIVHSSVLAQPYAADYVARYRSRFVVCGEPGADVDVVISSWEQTAEGLLVVLMWRGASYTIKAPLFGAQHVGNIALAFVAAVQVGVSAERALAALALTPQIKHRLEVKPQSDGTTYIDDAYNSNPLGFSAALDLLSCLVKNKGRRILVTPGLVELGAKHDEVHRELGMKAADCADVVIAVKPQRILAFLEGFRSKNGAAVLLEYETLNEALQWVRSNAQAHDVILLENDLPDLYERQLIL